MGSTTNFLFEGKPPASTTTYGTTVEGTPKWMSDYTQGLIARANAAAAEPYIPYGGPRIAGFDPAQETAFGLTEENVGAYRPYLEAGQAGAAGGLEAAGGMRERAQPYIDAATGKWTDPGVAESYMNPYISGVLERQEQLAQRTLEDKFLPGLQRAFAGAGQLGSRGGEGSMETTGLRGMQEIQEGLEAQRLASLGEHYGQAADIYGRDITSARELARVSGALDEAQAGAMYQGADVMGRMGEAAQRMGLTDAAAMEAVGAQRRGLEQGSLDLAYQDFLEQRDLPWDRLGKMSELIRGLPPSFVPRATQRTDVGPAQVYQPSPLSQIIGGYGVYRGMQGAEGGYVNGGLEDYADEYGLGGMVRDTGARLFGLGKQGAGALSRWARSLYPDSSRSVGVAGGKLLKLKHKQD